MEKCHEPPFGFECECSRGPHTPSELNGQVQVDKDSQTYLPPVYYDDFWRLDEHYTLLNSTIEVSVSLPLRILVNFSTHQR